MALYEAGTQDVLEIAEQAGAPDALFQLGLLYCSGREVQLDLVEAHKWFNLAALRGNESAKHLRTEIARELSRDEIGAAQRRAREWLACH